MQYKSQLLKWLIENPNWLTKTHDALFSTDPNLMRVFLTCKRVLLTKKPVSFSQLRYTLQSHPNLIETITSLENETSIDKATALQIREDLRLEALNQFIRRGLNIDLTDAKARAEYIKGLNELQLDDQPEDQLVISNFKNWKLHIEPEATTLDSGFPFLRGTGADFKRGRFYNFYAPSNEGKSQSLSHIVKHQISLGRNVLFFEMEGTDQEMFSRIGPGLLKMSPYQYEQLGVNDLELRYSTMQLGNLDTVWGKVVYVEELTDLIQKCEEERGYKYDYIVIDYSAQVKLKNSKKTSQQYQDDEEVFRQLKLVAIQQQKVLVSAVQVNRSGYNKKKSIDRDNAASSMGSVHASDLIIAQRYTTRIPDRSRTPQREGEHDEQWDDVKGLIKMEIIKKRKGTVKKGDKFYFLHLACGNLRAVQVDNTNQTEIEGMDALFLDDNDNENQ